MTSDGTAHAVRPLWRLRAMGSGDVEALCAIEWRAAQLFAAHGYASIAAEPPPTAADFAARFADAAVVVAADASGGLAGYAATVELGGWLWLVELTVDPAYGRQGAGTALLDRAAADARRRGLAGVALSTFRDVPFNAPFYKQRGYFEPEPGAAPAALLARMRAEVPPGVDPASRLLMLQPRTRSGQGHGA